MNYRRPLFWLALLCLLAELAAAELDFRLRLTAAALLLLFFALSLWQKRLHYPALLLLLSLCAGFTLHFRQVRSELLSNQERIAAFGELNVTLRGRVSEYHDTEEQSRIRLKDARLSSAYGSLETLSEDAPAALRSRYDQPVGDILVYLSPPCTVYPGQAVAVYGKMAALSPPRNEGGFNYPLYAAGLGLSGSMYGERLEITGGEAIPYQVLLQDIRSRVQSILFRLAPPEDAGVLQALLLGDKSNLDAELLSLYQENGIAHILAVSGLHLSILGMGFYRLLRRLRLSHNPAALVSALLILSYGILTGCSGSALRAVIMLLLQFLARSLGRTYDMLSALSAACLLLLCAQPYLLFSAGFQLSFGAVFSLALAAELPLPPHPLLSGLTQSLLLQLFTLPILLYHYFRLPVYSILLNLLVLPLLSFLVYAALLAICSSFLSVPLALICIGSAHGILRLYSLLCGFAAQLPGARFLPGRPHLAGIFCYYVLFFLFCGLLVKRQSCIAQQKDRRAQAELASQHPAPVFAKPLPLPLVPLPLLLGLLLLLPRPSRDLTITALDVGQGDGFVLRRGNAVVTIDMGSTSSGSLGKNVCLPYLKSQGIADIDLAILSHSDEDHISGLLYLLTETDAIEIRRLLLPAAGEADNRYDKLREAAEARSIPVSYLRAGDVLSLGDFSLLCLYPADNSYIEDANSHSDALLLSFGDFRMLFTGDLPLEQEPLLLRNLQRYTGGFPKLDILKAGHHGSHTSSSAEMLSALQPDYALLSYGAGNRYGHPHKETLDRLTDCHAEILATAEHGEIRIRVNEKSHEIQYPMANVRLP